ncbi:hypothetical protein GCM10027515_31640 [Schumannella luteola]
MNSSRAAGRLVARPSPDGFAGGPAEGDPRAERGEAADKDNPGYRSPSPEPKIGLTETWEKPPYARRPRARTRRAGRLGCEENPAAPSH